MVFGRNFWEKRQIWVFEAHFGEVGVTHDVGWWLVGKPMVDFLFALTELFRLSIRVPELWREMYTAGLFAQGCRPLCTQILPGQGRPLATILGVRKLETLGYLCHGEDRIPLRSLALTQYRNVTDGQTDEQIQRFAARCKFGSAEVGTEKRKGRGDYCMKLKWVLGTPFAACVRLRGIGIAQLSTISHLFTIMRRREHYYEIDNVRTFVMCALLTGQ